jgi:hypothetical protein
MEPARSAGVEVALPGGRVVSIRPVDPVADHEGLAAFDRSAARRYLCGGRPGGCGRCAERSVQGGGLALVAVNLEGEIVASAWVDPSITDPDMGYLALLLLPAYLPQHVAPAVLRVLAAEARRAGFARLVSCVPQQAHNTFEDFREAGLTLESSLGAGGVTEVVLALD